MSRKHFDKIDDRLTQNYVMTAAWLEQHPNYSWIWNFSVFKNMEFPKTVSSLIQNAPEHPEYEKLDLERLTEDDIDFERAVKSIPIDREYSL